MLMYSSKQLNEIRESVASSQWPDFLDEGFKNARGHWDPDRWHQNRKKGSTPPPGEGEKTIDRRERDSGYASHSVSERNISKPLGVQDRSIASTGDLNRVRSIITLILSLIGFNFYKTNLYLYYKLRFFNYCLIEKVSRP